MRRRTRVSMVKKILTGTGMLYLIDAYLVGLANRFASWLQEEHEQTMPGILSHAATATIACTAAAIVGMLVSRTPAVATIMLFFGSITIVAMLPLAQRYQRDAERGWSQGLARDYAIRAIGAQEAQRTMRVWGLFLVSVILTLSTLKTRPTDAVDMIVLMLVASTISHLYLACAEPRPPGSRRDERRLAFQGTS